MLANATYEDAQACATERLGKTVRKDSLMDRRQKRTRKAIVDAFLVLLARTDYAHITVQQIIDEADVGRTTFYDHFETKDELMHQLCCSLFSHVFDAAQDSQHVHGGQDDAGSNALLHVLHHIEEDDRKIQTLLLHDSTGTAKRYFREGVEEIIQDMAGSDASKDEFGDYYVNYLVSAFLDTTEWWLHKAREQEPSKIMELYTSASRSAIQELGIDH